MKTIIELFERSCNRFAENPYLWEKVGGKYIATTYADVKKEVLKFAGGLLSLGVNKGDCIALLSEGCNKWIYTELGILYAGGINVPLSIKLTDNEIVFRIEHSEAKYLVVSANFLSRIKRIESRLSGIKKVIVYNFDEPEGRYISYESLTEAGEKWNCSHPEEIRNRVNAIVSDDLVNISYTSGTTAEPKGIMLSHKNYVSNVLQSDSLIRIPMHYKVLLFLPWDHSFAHTVGIYSFMYNGASIAAVDFGRSPMEYLRNIPINLKEVQPDILLSVPSLAKSFKKSIEAGVKEKGKRTERLYRWGLALAYIYNGLGDDKGKGFRILLKPLVRILDKLLFSKIRQIFGGRLRFFIGGGALLDIELQRYYAALGVPMYQGYGLSEASPVISSNTPSRHRYGSSGIVVKPLDLKICDENARLLSFGETGEIWIRGGNVMKAYWKNEKSSRETVVDGWLHTGDLGYIEPEGWLYVLGRFKSLLISNDGEKYSPEGIEETIVEFSDYIDYCVLYNNQSPYTVGLIVPNVQTVRNYISSLQEEEDSDKAIVAALWKIQEELYVYRAGGRMAHLFPERWLPTAIAILPESLSDANGMINSSMKVVRGKVTEKFKHEIEYLYTPEGKEISNSLNIANLKRLLR